MDCDEVSSEGSRESHFGKCGIVTNVMTVAAVSLALLVAAVQPAAHTDP